MPTFGFGKKSASKEDKKDKERQDSMSSRVETPTPAMGDMPKQPELDQLINEMLTSQGQPPAVRRLAARRGMWRAPGVLPTRQLRLVAGA